MRPPRFSLIALTALSAAVFAGCQPTPGSEAAAPPVECDPDDGGLRLPTGFCALVVADDLGSVRHLVVRDNGDVYAAVRASRGGGSGGIVALRDGDDDGRAETIERFGEIGATGIGIFDGHLYLAPQDGVIRFPLASGELVPAAESERIVSGLPGPGTGHAAKNITIDADGNLYVNIGGPSNACQEEARTPGSAGLVPCPQLESRGGIWRFDARTPGQTQADGRRFATGLRNTFALAIHPGTGDLWGVQHGRDGVHDLWPDLYTEEQQAEIPAEEFVHIAEGDDFGWPYCFYDPLLERKVLAPEYGGDGTEVGRCAGAKGPAVALPGHWAPNALAFYDAESFPERYRGGAFVAFHGSWNRAPLPQGGYNVVFVEFGPGETTGEWEVFAEGFAGPDVTPGGAEHRPSGVAVGPDGSLYVSDDSGGRIWRILYTG